MELKNIKINPEVVFLIIIFSIFLWAGYGNLSGHSLSHDSMIGYFSADAVQDAGWAEGIKELGHYKYFAPWVSAGLEDTLAWYSPLIFHPVVLLSYLSGLEAYDALIFMVYFFAVVSAFIMYYIIKDYNKNIAILSVPFMLYIFVGKFYSSFLLGQWGYTIGCMFMIATFWAVTKLSEKKSYFLLALFIAGSVFTHPSETIFIAGFIGLYLIFNFITKNKKISINTIKKIFLAGIISIILSLYLILLIFTTGIGTANMGSLGGLLPKLGSPITHHYGYPGVYMEFFGFSLIFVIFGMLLSLKKLKKLHTSFLIGFFMLFVGYSNYLGGGIGERAFQNRFFWPIYLSVFFGTCIYFLSKLFVKKWKQIYSIGISILILFILMSVSYEKPSSSSMVTRERLEGLRWFHENSPKDSEIFFFYGEPYSQTSILWLTKRTHYLIDTEDFIKALNKKIIKREYLSRTTRGLVFYKTSFFSAEDYVKELGHEYFFKARDMCNFDYLVFDKASYNTPVLAQYNMIIASKLIENEHIKPVFSNNILVILKNENPGVDCIEQQTIA